MRHPWGIHETSSTCSQKLRSLTRWHCGYWLILTDTDGLHWLSGCCWLRLPFSCVFCIFWKRFVQVSMGSDLQQSPASLHTIFAACPAEMKQHELEKLTILKTILCIYIYKYEHMYTTLRVHVYLHYITLHHITLHCIALHRIALHCVTCHYISLRYIALHCSALHCMHLHLHCVSCHYISLRYIAVRCSAFHCIALHCIALHMILDLMILHYLLSYPIIFSSAIF